MLFRRTIDLPTETIVKYVSNPIGFSTLKTLSVAVAGVSTGFIVMLPFLGTSNLAGTVNDVNGTFQSQ